MTAIHGPKCHDFGIRGYGDPSSRLMLCGISPGPTEMKIGKPDQGDAGDLMNQCLIASGWDPEQAYHTNMCCFNTREPTEQEKVACRPRLYAEIEAFEPKVIVFFGAVPAHEFGIKRRGYIHWRLEPHPHWEMYTYHPASVLHGGNEFIYDIIRDLSKLPLMMEMEGVPHPEYNVVYSQLQAQLILDGWATRARASSTSKPLYLSLDIETRMHDPNVDELDIYTDDLICLAISDGSTTHVFPRDTLDGLNWPSGTESNIKWGFQGGQFDRAGLIKYLDVELPIDWDTMLQSYAGDEYAGTFTHPRKGQNKLETLTAEYFGDVAYKDDTKKAWRKKQQPPFHDLAKRNAYDAYYTWHLRPTLNRVRPPCPAYESLLIPAANMVSDVQRRGAYIDKVAHKALLNEWGPEYMDLIFQVQEHVANPKSWQQLSKYLYGPAEDGNLGLPGGPSTAKKILETIDHPFAQNVVALRELTYRMQNWVMGIKQHIKEDGRVHPYIMLHGTETGRRAYHTPPLQTIPKHGTEHVRIREIFGVTHPDWIMLEADYSQIEVWVGAYLSGDLNLLKDLQSGDVHGATAYRLGLDGSDKELRQVGKTLNFLMQYGGGGQKAQYTLALRGLMFSLAQCNSFVSTWRNAYPDYWDWTEYIWRAMQEDGFVESPFGRYRRCPLVTDPSWRAQFINWPVQSTAGDYILSSLIKLHSLLKPLGWFILFDVHDSGVFEGPQDTLHEAAAIIQEIMEEPKVGLPGVRVEMTIGRNLYKQVPFKPGAKVEVPVV